MAVRKIRKIPAMSARWKGLRENAGCAGLRVRVDFERPLVFERLLLRELAGLRFVAVLFLRVEVLLAAGFFAAGFRVVVLRFVELLRELAALRLVVLFFVVARLLAAGLVDFDFAIRPGVHDARLC